MEFTIDTDAVKVRYVQHGPDVCDPNCLVWEQAIGISISTYWSGVPAPKERHATARLLWSDAGIHVLFDAIVSEPMVVNKTPDLSRKSIGLWDRDVCEIFIAPDSMRLNEYFEFEVAPTGEWLDVKMELTPTERLSDWNFDSGIRCTAQINEGRSIMALEVPWTAFGKAPAAGDSWSGNLFRCVGTEQDRGYLAWRPTKTELPNFHVPAAFGKFLFIS